MPRKNIGSEWLRNTWRPGMAVVYGLIVCFDFIVFPILWSILQLVGEGQVTTAWNPITMSNGALFHIAMGAVLGISAWTRGYEKINQSKKRQ